MNFAKSTETFKPFEVKSASTKKVLSAEPPPLSVTIKGILYRKHPYISWLYVSLGSYLDKRFLTVYPLNPKNSDKSENTKDSSDSDSSINSSDLEKSENIENSSDLENSDDSENSVLSSSLYSSIPYEVMTGFLNKNNVLIRLSSNYSNYSNYSNSYYYDCIKHTINGEEFKLGEELSSYHPYPQYFHPRFINVYVDIRGMPYKHTPSKDFPILVNNAVKFYDSQTLKWNFYSPPKFAYECFTSTFLSDDVIVEIKNPHTSYIYCESNLKISEKKKQINPEPEGFAAHPSFKLYGIKGGEAYSLISQKPLKHGKLITIYIPKMKKKLMYNYDRFKIECLRQRVLSDSEFIVDGEIYQKGENFKYKGIEYKSTKNSDLYIGDDSSVWYIPYGRTVEVVDGFAVTGSKSKPKLIPIML